MKIQSYIQSLFVHSVEHNIHVLPGLQGQSLYIGQNVGVQGQNLGGPGQSLGGPGQSLGGSGQNLSSPNLAGLAMPSSSQSPLLAQALAGKPAVAVVTSSMPPNVIAGQSITAKPTQATGTTGVSATVASSLTGKLLN